MLRDVFIAFLFSLFAGLIFTILERTIAKLHRKYSFPWHIQRGTRKRRLNWNAVPEASGEEYMEWEIVNENSYDLESAIHDLRMHREIFGGQHYRLRNWRTKEIIPGELLLTDEPGFNHYVE